MIKLQVIGNLGKDAVVNNVNGRNVINFSVAHTERYKDAQGAQKERTTWVECAYWTDRTAIAPYLKKGTQVYVEGQPDVRTYSTQDGKQGASLSLRIANVQLLGSRQESSMGSNTSSGTTSGGSTYQSTNTSVEQTSDMSEPADDLPF
ncbi:single-stranded DNA-binding protein [Hydrotalea sp.]|uniref:single-stranded DNA-binding protein n=1 Tax=Hydrotalea sp. TaxID=2881279 RepID=UPI0026310DD9|nr:single-stranded DNA-binding protein [Hydrotalea sp.]